MTNAKDAFGLLLARLKEAPESYDANVKLGLHLYEAGEIDAALDRLETAAKVDGGSTEIHLFLGAVHREQGDLERSGEHLGQALSMSPDDFDAVYQNGLHNFICRDLSGAYGFFKRALGIRGDNPELLNDLGVVLFSMGRRAEALGYLEKAMEMDPDNASSRLNLGFVQLALGNVVAARAAYDVLLQQEPAPAGLDDLGASIKRAEARQPVNDEGIARSLGLSERVGRIKPMCMVKDFGEHGGEALALSVIVPILNEVDNIPILYGELNKALQGCENEYEIIFVDDGSKDGSREVLGTLADEDRRVKVVLFRRNYGQTAALSAGFKYCRGEVVVTLDGDLQNDPADIPMLLDKMAEGYDLVNGWRKDRKDKAITRKVPSWAANRIINKLIEGTGVQLHDFGCTLKAYKRGIVKNIHLYGEMHRFIPVFAAWLGVEVAEVPVNHRPRIHGKAKYGLGRVWRVIFDLIVVRFFSDYMTRPIQFFGKIAKKAVGFGSLAIALLFAVKVGVGLPITYDTLLILLALLWLSGLNIIVMGLTGELLTRSYFELQDKDHYVVENILNG